MKILIFIVVLFLLFNKCSLEGHCTDDTAHKNGEAVSLIQLIANPDSFDGKHVLVSGFLVLREEYEDSLFLDKNSYEAKLFQNSIAVDFSHDFDGIKKFPENFNGEYVLISGTFKSGDSVFSVGTIDIVYSITPLD